MYPTRTYYDDKLITSSADPCWMLQLISLDWPWSPIIPAFWIRQGSSCHSKGALESTLIILIKARRSTFCVAIAGNLVVWILPAGVGWTTWTAWVSSSWAPKKATLRPLNCTTPLFTLKLFVTSDPFRWHSPSSLPQTRNLTRHLCDHKHPIC